MEEQALVTIGIPTCRVNDYLFQSIDSCLNQTYKNTEVLVFCDGVSEDELASLNFKYQFNPRVRLIIEPERKGIGFGRKTLVDNASGLFLAFCSDDDLLEPDAVDIWLRAYKVGCFVYADYYNIDPNGNILGVFTAPVFEDDSDFRIAVLNYANRNDMFVMYGTIFSDIDTWRANNFSEKYKLGEDLHHILKTALVNKVKFIKADKITSRYRRHPHQTTNEKIHALFRNNQNIREEIFAALNK